MSRAKAYSSSSPSLKPTVIPRAPEHKDTTTLNLPTRDLLAVTQRVPLSDAFPVIEDHAVARSAEITPSVPIAMIVAARLATRHLNAATVGRA